MNNLQAALLHGLKVLGHVALSAAIAGVFSWLIHNPAFMLYTPVINVAEATVWKYLFPTDPVPTN